MSSKSVGEGLPLQPKTTNGSEIPSAGKQQNGGRTYVHITKRESPIIPPLILNGTAAKPSKSKVEEERKKIDDPSSSILTDRPKEKKKVKTRSVPRPFKRAETADNLHQHAAPQSIPRKNSLSLASSPPLAHSPFLSPRERIWNKITHSSRNLPKEEPIKKEEPAERPSPFLIKWEGVFQKGLEEYVLQRMTQHKNNMEDLVEKFIQEEVLSLLGLKERLMEGEAVLKEHSALEPFLECINPEDFLKLYHQLDKREVHFLCDLIGGEETIECLLHCVEPRNKIRWQEVALKAILLKQIPWHLPSHVNSLPVGFDNKAISRVGKESIINNFRYYYASDSESDFSVFTLNGEALKDPDLTEVPQERKGHCFMEWLIGNLNQNLTTQSPLTDQNQAELIFKDFIPKKSRMAFAEKATPLSKELFSLINKKKETQAAINSHLNQLLADSTEESRRKKGKELIKKLEEHLKTGSPLSEKVAEDICKKFIPKKTEWGRPKKAIPELKKLFNLIKVKRELEKPIKLAQKEFIRAFMDEIKKEKESDSDAFEQFAEWAKRNLIKVLKEDTSIPGNSILEAYEEYLWKQACEEYIPCFRILQAMTPSASKEVPFIMKRVYSPRLFSKEADEPTLTTHSKYNRTFDIKIEEDNFTVAQRKFYEIKGGDEENKVKYGSLIACWKLCGSTIIVNNLFSANFCCEDFKISPEHPVEIQWKICENLAIIPPDFFEKNSAFRTVHV